MSVGALNRSQVRTNLSTMMGSASGVGESDWIDLESGPQGRAHQYWSIVSISSADSGHRARVNNSIGRRYSVVVRYAHRINPKQRATSRDAALDALDELERSLRNNSSSSRANLEIVDWSDSERLSGSREWLIWDITVSALALLDLSA